MPPSYPDWSIRPGGCTKVAMAKFLVMVKTQEATDPRPGAWRHTLMSDSWATASSARLWLSTDEEHDGGVLSHGHTGEKCLIRRSGVGAVDLSHPKYDVRHVPEDRASFTSH